MRPVEGTILTVVREAADGAEPAWQRAGALVDVPRRCRDAGQLAHDRPQPELLPWS
jgi:dihydroxyacetone kinase-like predicted kinase